MLFFVCLQNFRRVTLKKSDGWHHHLWVKTNQPEADPTSRSFDDLTDLLYVVVPQGSGARNAGVMRVL